MKTILLISLFCLVQGLHAHDFEVGRYEIKPEGDHLSLNVRLDHLNLLHAVSKDCQNHYLLDGCFAEYISSHFKLSFDGVEGCFEYQNHEVDNQIISIDFIIPIKPAGIKHIEVSNSVFLDFVEDQENLVYSYLNDMRRSFRLNKDRTKTRIEY